MSVERLLLVTVVVALAFDFTNGAHDAATAIATVVATKTMTVGMAITMAVVLNVAGALTGTEVAKTISGGLLSDSLEHSPAMRTIVVAAVLGAMTWNIITWRLAIPSSSSHALVGGLVGAAFVEAGVHAETGAAFRDKVLIPLVCSPLIGMLVAFVLMVIVFAIASTFLAGRAGGVAGRSPMRHRATPAPVMFSLAVIVERVGLTRCPYRGPARWLHRALCQGQRRATALSRGRAG